MRPVTIAGLLVLALGAFVLLRGASYSSRHNVLKVGDLKVTATQEESVPAWVGGMMVVVGLGLIVVGTRKRA